MFSSVVCSPDACGKVKQLKAAQHGLLAEKLSASQCHQRCHTVLQHDTVQLGVTDFAAVLHTYYVLQHNLSDFVFTFILKIPFM